MEETELAYTAGIIDGEGCIGIYLMQSKNQKAVYCLRIGVHTTSEYLTQYLSLTYGGFVYDVNYKNKNWKHQWQWSIACDKALKFLKQVYPYLRLKKPQAEVAIKFQELRRGSGHHLTEEERVIAESQRILMSNLNKRGVIDINKEESR